MGIKKDPKTGKWLASYSKRPKGGGNPVNARRKGINSKAEAQRVFAELILQVESKLKKEEVPTWEATTNEFISRNRGINWTDKTADNYFLHLKAHTFNIWGDRFIDEITTADIKSLVNGKLKKKSPSHRKSMIKFINGVFNFAVEEGLIFRNPVPKMKFQIKNKIKKGISEKEIRLVLRRAKEMNIEWYPIWATALYTGLRNGELYALTWDCVDFDRRQILVCKSWNNKDGFKDYTKSGDDRFVGIAPQLLNILQDLKRSQSDSIHVLPRIDKWTKGEQARELRMFLAGLGLQPIRFHDLRASWATVMLGKGTAPIKVMAMGGWKDLKTMERYVRQSGLNLAGITDDLKF